MRKFVRILKKVFDRILREFCENLGDFWKYFRENFGRISERILREFENYCDHVTVHGNAQAINNSTMSKPGTAAFHVPFTD